MSHDKTNLTSSDESGDSDEVNPLRILGQSGIVAIALQEQDQHPDNGEEKHT